MRSSKELRAMGRYRLTGKWGMSVLVSFVATILGLGGSVSGGNSINSNLEHSEYSGQIQDAFETIFANPLVYSIILSIIAIIAIVGIALYIVGSAIELGHCRYYIGLAGGETPEFAILFSRFSIFIKALGLRLYRSLFVFLWSLLLVIPGIIASYRYAMAPYLMAQYPEKGIAECIADSKALMLGHKGRLFLLDLSFIGWAILCIFTAGLGMLWLNPYTHASRAVFYLERTGQIPAPVQETANWNPQPEA